MTAPYAKALITVDSADPTSGGLTVSGGVTITLTGESTTGWTSARWEIYAYPPGWTAPSGWTLGSDGVIYSTSLAPTAFALPAVATRWGKWLVRLSINGAVTDPASPSYVAALVDDTSGWQTLAPSSGLADLAVLERYQFGALARSWVRDHQTNLRTLEAHVTAPTFPTASTPANPANGTMVLWYDGTNLRWKRTASSITTTGTITLTVDT